MRVLFCSDGSKHSEYAIEYACKIFKSEMAATVLYISPRAGSIYDHYMVVEEDFSKKVIEISSRILQRAIEILDNYGIKAQIKERSGHAADEIIKEINSKDYDIVVVGSHGASGISTFMLGSVSTKVVMSSIIPVMVVKSPPK